MPTNEDIIKQIRSRWEFSNDSLFYEDLDKALNRAKATERNDIVAVIKRIQIYMDYETQQELKARIIKELNNR